LHTTNVYAAFDEFKSYINALYKHRKTLVTTQVSQSLSLETQNTKNTQNHENTLVYISS